MNTWKIAKDFDFDYGHRVWTQQLNEQFCAQGDTKCVCRHIHGHRGRVVVHLESNQLDYRGFVCDFKEIGWLKDFLDNYVDHKFIIDTHDPLFNQMITTPLRHVENKIMKDNHVSGMPPNEWSKIDAVNVYIPGTLHCAGAYYNTSAMSDCPEKEYLDGFFIVDFVPTSENLSKWLYDIVDAKMSLLGVKTSHIDWFETPKSRSTYYGDKNDTK